jgi:translation initiation factor eIF-2B subunit epsilon
MACFLFPMLNGLHLLAKKVPPLFTENFDYQTVRPDFIVGILTSDLLGKTIACSIVSDDSTVKRPTPARQSSSGWAALLGDVKTYDAARCAAASLRSLL